MTFDSNRESKNFSLLTLIVIWGVGGKLSRATQNWLKSSRVRTIISNITAFIKQISLSDTALGKPQKK